MRIVFLSLIAAVSLGAAGGWSEPVEVRHDETLCLSYQARVEGAYLVVKAKIEPGWHTFSMDNKERVEEKLAGKKALGIDQPTKVTLTGLAADGSWLQTAPQDFSKPDLRWFSYGFEKEAVFAVKVKGGGAGAKLGVRGQACSDTTCKNIDVTIALPDAKPGVGNADLKGLIAVR